MTLSLKSILSWCEQEKKEFWEYMLYEDMQERSVSREESVRTMERIFDLMLDTVENYSSSRFSHSGLSGADGGLMEQYYRTHDTLCGSFVTEAMVIALKTAESNACMRRIVAAPTAGSCGIIPAVLIPYYKKGLADKEHIVRALYTAGAIGEVISERASVSGAYGGCQAEIGSASAMAAGMLAYLLGGNGEQICHAAALAMKGLLGLVCDPVAGLVEIPCIKRNVIGTVNAVSCAEMAMAGIKSKIPADEVFDAMNEIGEKMDTAFKETAMGGLAATNTGKKITEELSGEKTE